MRVRELSPTIRIRTKSRNCSFNVIGFIRHKVTDIVKGCAKNASCGVASCVLRVASCELRVASCELRVASCELRVASCELRVASCELRVASCQNKKMKISSKDNVI